MCHGKIVCKYLISDIWLFNKIACLSTEELGFLFSNRSSLQRDVLAYSVHRDLAVQLCALSRPRGDILSLVPCPTAGSDSL